MVSTLGCRFCGVFQFWVWSKTINIDGITAASALNVDVFRADRGLEEILALDRDTGQDPNQELCPTL